MPEDRATVRPPREEPGAPGGRRRSRNRTWLERAVHLHLGALIVGISWAFGGQAPWVRTVLLGWGTLGIVLFFVAFALLRQGRPERPPRPWRDLWPLWVFDVFVALSCLNPSTKIILRGIEPYLMFVSPPFSWLPSSARPGYTLAELWQFNGIVFSCYNAYLVFEGRRALRTLLYLIVLNSVALAVFGTFQKLMHAPGLWFGLVESPQVHFFSTFVYHNHWGAFVLLSMAACLGVFFHAWRRGDRHRDLLHSPVPAWTVATLLLAAAVPLSASRSSTALLGLFLLGALVHFLVRIIRQRRALHESPLLPVAGVVLAVVLATGSVVYLGREVIAQRAVLTAEQFSSIRQEVRLNARLVLYRDTIRMGMEKPWFGWGLETYGDVFRVYNSASYPLHGGWKPYYREAHSDWLQSFAETGIVGTTLLVLLGALPLRRIRWRRLESSIPAYLLAGCGLVLLYAWVEFPFANPSVMIGFWTSYYVALRYATLDLGNFPSNPDA